MNRTIACFLAACLAAAPASANSHMSSTRYDPDNRVTGTIGVDPDGADPLGLPAVRNSYDSAGRLIRVEQGSLSAWQPEGVAPALWPGFTVHKFVDTSYDALDRKTVEAVSGMGPSGAVAAGVTEYGYDLAGRLLCTAVRMNPDSGLLLFRTNASPARPTPSTAPTGSRRTSTTAPAA